MSISKVVGTRTRRASLGAVASVAAVVALAPAASAADSYPLTSSTYNISPWHRESHTGYCADGFHVSGTWSNGPIITGSRTAVFIDALFRRIGLRATSSGSWNPKVTANGDYISVWDTSGAQQNGVDTDGNPTYQGVTVTLSNASLISSHGGSFTWTCDPN